MARTARQRDGQPKEHGVGAASGSEPEPRSSSDLEAEFNGHIDRAEAALRAEAATSAHRKERSRERPSELRGIARQELVEDFRTACISRAIDDREITLQKQSRVFFQISGAGHEMLLLGLARSLRPAYDWFFPYYRDQALCLGLGVTPRDILLQAVGSAEDPSSGGRQMPSHWGSKRLNIVTQSSPTGSQCLPAVGCAEAARYIAPRQALGALDSCTAQGDEVTYVSLGEGATSEGEFWESLNTAARLHLPMLFLVADNGYAISVRAADQAPAPVSELVRGFRGLAIHKFDGCDYFAARTKGAQAIARVRAGEGPGLIHATVTRPYSHSSQDTQAKYRSAEELLEEAHHDPILRLEQQLIRGGLLTVEEAAAIREEARQLIADVARETLLAARPDPATVLEHVLALPRIEDPVEVATTAGSAGAAGSAPAAPAGHPADPMSAPATRGEPVGMGDAIRLTLTELMSADERIRVFGEDVADAPEEVLEQVEGKGGVFGTTHRLQTTFGVARCYNTPLAEANIIGRGIGQALRGLKPCAEIQFFDYIWPATHQIRAEAATTRWRSQGQFTVPLVIRCAIGGYVRGGALWHSQCGESIFAHMPGLIIVFPSRARDAAGLLRAAFRCDDPVLFLEHKHLLRQKYAMDPFPPADYVLPLGRAATVREGKHLSIVTWGATVQRSMQAAEAMAADGLEVEVIDLRTLIPWDKEAVAASVAKTSKLLVVHEDVLTGGFGGEVAAWAGEHCFADLDAPIRRIGATDTFVAYEPTLEAAILPQAARIEQVARELAEF